MFKLCDTVRDLASGQIGVVVDEWRETYWVLFPNAEDVLFEGKQAVERSEDQLCLVFHPE